MKTLFPRRRTILILPVLVILIISSAAPALAASQGITYGLGQTINLTAGQNAFYGQISAGSAAGSNLILLEQPQGTPKFKVDKDGNVSAVQYCNSSGGNCFTPGTNMDTTNDTWAENGSEVYTNEDVGIGTNNPSAYGLHVYRSLGSGLKTGLMVTSNGSNYPGVLVGNTNGYFVGSSVDGNDFIIEREAPLGTPSLNYLVRVSPGGQFGIGCTGASAYWQCDTAYSLDVRPTTGYSRINNSVVGALNSGDANYTYFTHYSRPGANQYALFASAAGNTALNADAAQYINFNIGNTMKMMLDSEGDLGIGVGWPTVKLQVTGSVLATGYNEPNARGALIAGDGTNALIYSRNGTSGWAPMYIDASATYINPQSGGNVGVGTASPGAKLHVVGQNAIIVSGAADQYVYMGRDTAQGLSVYANDNSTYLESLQDENVAGYGNMIFRVDNDGTADGYFAFQNKAGTEFMRINSGGAMGIGTSSVCPTCTKLQVQGATTGITTTGTMYGVQAWGGASGAAYQANNSAASGNGININATGAGAFDVYSQGAQSYFAGNVGIGVTPGSHKLQVAGTVHADITGGNGNLDSTAYEVAGTNIGGQTYYAYGSMCVGNAAHDCSGAGGSVITSSGVTTGSVGASSVTASNHYVNSGSGNGICFWGDCTNYKIHMGTGAEYFYGPVQDYSIKMNMNSGDSDRGWTWGYAGSAPIAAISGGGNMQVAGYLYAGNYLQSPTVYVNGLRYNQNGAYLRGYSSNNSSGGFEVLRNDGNRWGYFYADGDGIGVLGGNGGWSILSRGSVGSANTGISLFTNGTERFTINSSGSVGVNTASPAAKFHVYDTSGNTSILELAGGNCSNSWSDVSLRTRCTTGEMSGSFGSGLAFEVADTGGAYTAGTISTVRQGADDLADMLFSLRDSGTNLDERMRINKNGNVSIGVLGGQAAGRLHVTNYNNYGLGQQTTRIQVGATSVWSNSNYDSYINFGDQDFVYIGERGGDDRMEIRAGTYYFSGGSIGVGTNAPSDYLDVRGYARLGSWDTNTAIRFTDWWSGYPDASDGSELSNDTGSYKTLMIVGNNTYNGSTRMIGMWDNVGIRMPNPSYSLQLAADSAGKPNGGSWANSSDGRLKTDVNQINGQEALEKLSLLKGVTYRWINPGEHAGETGVRASVIAQELKEVFPQWVMEIDASGKDKDLVGPGGKAYSISFPHDFNAYLIEALKELKKQNEALRAENQGFAERLKALEDKIK